LLLVAGCDDDRTIVAPPRIPPVRQDIIAALSYCYQFRDLKLFSSLLAHDPDRNAEYIHAACDTTWGYDEEIRRHRRLFHPEDTLPGEPPVPPELWVNSLSLNLTQFEPFQERQDLYSANGGADGKLDPTIWRAWDACYSVELFVETVGEASPDYQITSEANFTIIEDRTKRVGERGKFLLLSWEDVCDSPPPWPADAAPRGLPITATHRPESKQPLAE